MPTLHDSNKQKQSGNKQEKSLHLFSQAVSHMIKIRPYINGNICSGNTATECWISILVIHTDTLAGFDKCCPESQNDMRNSSSRQGTNLKNNKWFRSHWEQARPEKWRMKSFTERMKVYIRGWEWRKESVSKIIHLS